MIAGWLVYCLVVSTLLAAGAAAGEALLTRFGRSARWVWLVALGGSLVVPGVAFAWQQRTPRPIEGAGEARFGDVFERIRQRERQHPPRTADAIVARIPRPRTPQLDGDRVAFVIVIACIILATLRVAVDSIVLYRQRRRWESRMVDGEAVLVSADLGPAIVGLLEPVIVLPDWAASLGDDERRLVLAHEREHVRARDAVLASCALLGVLLMPWNPAAWWLFRRLRTAIEIDCDRRVLRVFPDVARYGRLLVDVAQRAGDGSSLAITGFSERAGPLVRRIRAMTVGRHSIRIVGVINGAICAIATFSAFIVLPPPAATQQLPGFARRERMLAKGVGDSIVSYRVAELTLATSRTVAAARDLPAVFDPDTLATGPGEGMPAAGRCGTWLRDQRTGARLHRIHSETGTTGVAQRGDTAWTRVTSVGFYRVDPAGAYGVGDGQLLRVGCGSVNHRVVTGQRDRSHAISDLESTDDARARRISDAVQRAIGFKSDAVELYSGRLNVVITKPDWLMEVTPAMRASTSKQVWDAAQTVIGEAAMPETLAFSVRIGDGSAGTFLYYKRKTK